MHAELKVLSGQAAAGAADQNRILAAMRMHAVKQCACRAIDVQQLTAGYTALLRALRLGQGCCGA
jgi:hypothetical protein